MSHSVAVTKRVTVGMIVVLGALFFQAGIASAQTPQQQLAEAKAQLEQLSAQFNTPTKQVLGATTSAAAIIPTCTVNAEKASYMYGETIVISWTTTNAKSLKFLRNEVKDDLVYPTEKLKKNGSVSIDASVIGNPTIKLEVTSKTGDKVLCTKAISVKNKSTDGVAKLVLQLQKVQNKIDAIEEKIAALQLKQAPLVAVADGLRADIAELTGESSDDDSGIEARFTDSDEDIEGSAVNFTAQFEVTANDTDAYIRTTLLDNSKFKKSGYAGVFYRIMNGEGITVKTETASMNFTSSADEEGDSYLIEEGETEDFEIKASFKPAVTGSYYLELTGIGWKDSPNGSIINVPLSQKFSTQMVAFTQLKG